MKQITMSCHNIENAIESGNSYVLVNYHDAVTWPEIVEQFNRFIAAMGYIPLEYNQFVKAIAQGEENCCGDGSCNSTT